MLLLCRCHKCTYLGRLAIQYLEQTGNHFTKKDLLCSGGVFWNYKDAVFYIICLKQVDWELDAGFIFYKTFFYFCFQTPISTRGRRECLWKCDLHTDWTILKEGVCAYVCMCVFVCECVCPCVLCVIREPNPYHPDWPFGWTRLAQRPHWSRTCWLNRLGTGTFAHLANQKPGNGGRAAGCLCWPAATLQCLLSTVGETREATAMCQTWGSWQGAAHVTTDH